jgi:hypothetical protein
MSLVDITENGTPELMIGAEDNREGVYYSVVDMKTLDFLFGVEASSYISLFDNKKYTDSEGNKYYIATIFNGNQTYLEFTLTKVWCGEGIWNNEVTHLYNEDRALPEEYEPLITSTVQINPDDVKGSVEQCFIEYFSQIENHVEAEQ